MSRVRIYMHGAIEPIELEDGFQETTNLLNNAAAQGRQFAATTDSQGRKVLINVPNILSAEEIDDDDGLVY